MKVWYSKAQSLISQGTSLASGDVVTDRIRHIARNEAMTSKTEHTSKTGMASPLKKNF